MARLAPNIAAKADQSVMDFETLPVPREGAHVRTERITLCPIVSGGDNAKPVLTLSFPGGDLRFGRYRWSLTFALERPRTG